MAAYLVVDTHIENPEAYEDYKIKARAIAEKHGGEYLARGGPMRVVDSDLWTPERMVIIRFPDRASAEAFVDSEEYRPVAAIRHANAKSTVVLVEGL